MKLILETGELSEYLSKVSDWYNEMSIYVLTNVIENPEIGMGFRDRDLRERFHKLCKKFQENHPKPSWKDLLPD